jgi:hypothetical protein
VHHTIAWRLSSADATATDLTPVTDAIMVIQNGHFLPQVNYSMLYAYAGAASINRARFISPAFRQLSTPWIRPVNAAIAPTDEVNIADYRLNPLLIRGLEELQLEGTQTSGGAAVIVGVAGITKQGLGPSPQGDIITMRGTGTTTQTAGGWTVCAITWQDTLPTGMYACVGCEFVAATGVAGRLVFEDQVERPGGLAQTLATGNGPLMFRKGGLGIWGRFSGNRMPNVEMLSNAADTAQEIYLDLVRVG